MVLSSFILFFIINMGDPGQDWRKRGSTCFAKTMPTQPSDITDKFD